MDPTTDVALALHGTPGVYAVLLGSGVSRAAQIPTGWDVVLDLIRRLAVAGGHDVPDDPAGWYHEQYDRDADYSEIVEQLAATPAERQALLRGYFEPTDEEREEGVKVPSAAHHAIADLASRGIVRVILTTNFDRLWSRRSTPRGSPTLCGRHPTRSQVACRSCTGTSWWSSSMATTETPASETP